MHMWLFPEISLRINPPSKPLDCSKRRIKRIYCKPEVLLFSVLFQVGDSLTYSSDGLSLFVRNGNVEFLFEFHDKFNCVQRVCTQIISKRSFICNLSFFNT